MKKQLLFTCFSHKEDSIPQNDFHINEKNGVLGDYTIPLSDFIIFNNIPQMRDDSGDDCYYGIDTTKSEIRKWVEELKLSSMNPSEELIRSLRDIIDNDFTPEMSYDLSIQVHRKLDKMIYKGVIESRQFLQRAINNPDIPEDIKNEYREILNHMTHSFEVYGSWLDWLKKDCELKSTYYLSVCNFRLIDFLKSDQEYERYRVAWREEPPIDGDSYPCDVNASYYINGGD